MRKEACMFSGLPVHPGHGKRYVPAMVQATRPVLTFLHKKSRNLYLQKKNPRNIRWTVTYRRINKKSTTADQIRKRAKKTKRVLRPIVGADLEEIKQKQDNRLSIRAAAREAALNELKARKAKAKAAEAKKGPKAKPQSKQLPQAGKQIKKSGR
eukprot:NODE_5839_length_603_cov_669.743697_g5674_i0.p2 GENE.NODE_5839_length_603_cov_669.743697_g5674_i0~~NODE_5839_length_603_cov_669.743697_g5674_i0.p2  ORF type:complete len:154 (+),score=21.93 NODE_5839_length_603_cov_669.743697_g5674_i0:73-534(+)